MVKVWDENNVNTLHNVYGNNHFEPTDTCYQIEVSFNCQSQNMCEPTIKNNELHNKWKKITWTFQLENNLLEIQK
jgi:hypothetical protein